MPIRALRNNGGNGQNRAKWKRGPPWLEASITGGRRSDKESIHDHQYQAPPCPRALKLPRKIGDLINIAQVIVKAMTGNPSFPNPRRRWRR